MKPDRLAKSDVDHSQGLKKQIQSFNQAQGFYLKGTEPWQMVFCHQNKFITEYVSNQSMTLTLPVPPWANTKRLPCAKLDDRSKSQVV